MRRRQREIALGVVVLALFAFVVWRVRSATPGQLVTNVATAPAQQGGTQSLREKGDAAAVDLQALKAERPQPEESDRNPFRFKPKAPPPPPPQPAKPAPSRSSDPLATGPAEPPPPPPIPLKFIGLASSKDDARIGRVAILSDARGVYYGREGDIIEGRYRILKIGVESIDLAYLDGRGRQTLRQTGQ